MTDKKQSAQLRYYYRNKEKLRAYQARWAKDNPDKVAEAKRKHAERSPEKSAQYSRKYRQRNKGKDAARQRLRKTGWTLEAFESAITAQDNKCALCVREFDTEKPSARTACADHCHVTSKPRALLCRNCNLALGLFEDDADCLERAAAYVRRFAKLNKKENK